MLARLPKDGMKNPSQMRHLSLRPTIDGIEEFYHRFRVLKTGLQTGRTQVGRTCMSCAGIELYGFFRPRP